MNRNEGKGLPINPTSSCEPPHEPAREPSEWERIVVRIDRDFAPMIPRFMDNRRKELTAMREATARSEYETVRKLAHGIKGAGGSYGFDELTLLAADLELAAKASHAANVRAGLAALERYLAAIDVQYVTSEEGR